MNLCSNCHKPANESYVCEACLSQLANDLGDCPWLDDQLEITRTRQRAAGAIGAGSSSGERALPWHGRASDNQRALHATLARLVRTCQTHRVRNSSPDQEAGPAANTVEAMSRWLLWRVDGLAYLELGGRAAADVHQAAERARGVIFFKPLPKQYLGVCDQGPTDCPGEVYAETGSPAGHCNVCFTEYPVYQRRRQMETALDDRLCTAAEIASLATYLGLDADRTRIRKAVNLWHARKRIRAVGAHEDGDPRFRYGEVKVMLYQAFAKDAG